MTFKQHAAALMVICLGLVVGSCSGFSGYVADHWPHWAGGMPEDAPPRPGAPGYDEFIAHRQPDPDAVKPAASTKTIAPAPPADNPARTDPAVGPGGLY